MTTNHSELLMNKKEFKWNKKRNLQIAKCMTFNDLRDTDVLEFLKIVISNGSIE